MAGPTLGWAHDDDRLLQAFEEHPVKRSVVVAAVLALAALGGYAVANLATDVARVVARFKPGVDVGDASKRTREAIAAIEGRRPAGSRLPDIADFDPADEPVVALILGAGALERALLTQVADSLVSPRLRRVQGVAEVAVLGGKDSPTVARFGDDPAVLLEIRKARGQRATQVTAAIRGELTRIRAGLPPGVELKETRDEGTTTARSVSAAARALGAGAALMLVVGSFFSARCGPAPS
jgi:multidrug efflux pump subunit AcrB